MSKDTNFDEKRLHKRMKVPNAARAIINKEEQDVQLIDVSAGGASIELDHDLENEDSVELQIEDVGELSAQVSRSFDDSVAVRFLDIDDQEEEMLLADLERTDFGIKTEEF